MFINGSVPKRKLKPEYSKSVAVPSLQRLGHMILTQSSEITSHDIDTILGTATYPELICIWWSWHMPTAAWPNTNILELLATAGAFLNRDGEQLCDGERSFSRTTLVPGSMPEEEKHMTHYIYETFVHTAFRAILVYSKSANIVRARGVATPNKDGRLYQAQMNRLELSVDVQLHSISSLNTGAVLTSVVLSDP